MLKSGSRLFRLLLGVALCGVIIFHADKTMLSVQAEGTKKVMVPRYTALKEGDLVAFSDCYFSQKAHETVNKPELAPPVAYEVTDRGRYEKAQKTRIMELTASGTIKKQIKLTDIAFVSAVQGGKDSSFENGQDLTPVKMVEKVDGWKLTIKNPYDEKKNPDGMRMPVISNVERLGNCIVFDYKDLYNTGNTYLSAVIYNKNKSEVVAYDRIVDSAERGIGTAVINWNHEYDEQNCVLEVFAEKYNGDYMTDYISNMRMVYRGVDKKWEDTTQNKKYN